MFYSALMLGLGLASHASAACTRDALQDAATAYGKILQYAPSFTNLTHTPQ
jgi:hypothetical protein